MAEAKGLHFGAWWHNTSIICITCCAGVTLPELLSLFEGFLLLATHTSLKVFSLLKVGEWPSNIVILWWGKKNVRSLAKLCCLSGVTKLRRLGGHAHRFYCAVWIPHVITSFRAVPVFLSIDVSFKNKPMDNGLEAIFFYEWWSPRLNLVMRCCSTLW